MLTIAVGAERAFNDETQTFVFHGGVELQLEHSLVSLSKWESKYEKPFLEAKEKSPEELLDYVKFMIVTPDFPMEVLGKLTEENVDEINDYMNAKMTATWFNDVTPQSRNREIITAELIYYWMTVFNIPFTCETWHLNRLFTLIRVCNLKQEKPKRMNRREMADRRRLLNEQRKQQLNTRG